MNKEILKKNCEYCGKEFKKPYACSYKEWEDRKYCCRDCVSKSKLGKKRKPFSNETKKKMSLTRIGIKLSDETKEKIKLSKLGKKHSEKQNKKQSERMSGKNSHFYKDGRSIGENKKITRCFYEKRRRARKFQNGGSHTIEEWETLKVQYNWTCPHCNKSEPEIKLTQDHIIPLSKGGSDNIENIQPLCKSCNSKKGIKITLNNKSGE
jgi:5-methylcytosine-specific restriction endonuclease McrA